MNKGFLEKIYNSHQACALCPSPLEVSVFFIDLLGALFADFSTLSFPSVDLFEKHVNGLNLELRRIIQFSNSKTLKTPEQTANEFFELIPTLYEKLQHDITAMFEGDPAAKSRSEVIRTYPGFYAVAAYRIASALHALGVEDTPRVITEHAHNKTGIDIHPAAKIGEYFCIDHGTGVVIGETSVIGDHVKLYQGVTLGALSVNKDDAERKRHPTLEDNVIVYAGATILGGETIIGRDSIIGGNVWITRSIPPHSKIYYQAKMYNDDTDETDLVIFK